MDDPFFGQRPQGEQHLVTAEGDYVLAGEQPAWLKLLAQAVSYIFHPLFIPSYTTFFLLYVHPYVFPDTDPKTKLLKGISAVVLTAFFPAFSVFLLKQLGFIQSFFLKTQKERIIPYIISMFFYFWIFYVSMNLSDSPPLYRVMLLGVFLSCIAAYMANIYYKVSMHAVAMGSFMTFFLLLSLRGGFFMGGYLSLAILIAGVVCTARLIVSAHHPFDVYTGFFMGVICQGVASWILL